jgi:hypothetical protein
MIVLRGQASTFIHSTAALLSLFHLPLRKKGKLPILAFLMVVKI